MTVTEALAGVVYKAYVGFLPMVDGRGVNFQDHQCYEEIIFRKWGYLRPQDSWYSKLEIVLELAL